jgi:quercetin dioxygenase-like cupin family protein
MIAHSLLQSGTMKLHDWQELPPEPLNPLLTRQAIHTERMTVARLHLKAGCKVPPHTHGNEQVSMVLSGRLKFLLDGGAELVVKAGQVLEIPSMAAHGVEVLEDAIVLDLFAPRREDWVRGDDAYLRK